ncbi:MAG: hypothetical protein JW862_04170, partial [Anaerolineales bacterium]|nr:hypothetical protein [Anaerolineales bacterium]
PYRASDHDPVLVGLYAFDFSDLDSSYGVAWHGGGGDLRLGSNWQAGMDYAPGADNADDDGVTLVTATWQPGGSLTFDLTTSGPGYLAAWFDWDRDGSFEAHEKALSYTFSAAGTVRQTAIIGDDFNASSTERLPARFRLYSSEPLLGPTGNEAPSGAGNGGEVEDYSIIIGPTAVRLLAFQAHSPGWPGLAILGIVAGGWLLGGFKRRERGG